MIKKYIILIVVSLLLMSTVVYSDTDTDVDLDDNGDIDIAFGGTNTSDGSISATKTSGVPGYSYWFEAETTNELFTGFQGPADLSVNISHVMPSSAGTVGQVFEIDTVQTGQTLPNGEEGTLVTLKNGDKGSGSEVTLQTSDPTVSDASGIYLNTTDGDAFIVSQNVGVSTWATTYTPAPSATDFTQDADMISWWFFEDASTPSLDGSTNNNDAVWGGTPTQTTTHIQGSYSIDFASASFDRVEVANADLAPSDFPGKETTGAQNTFTVGIWVRLDSAPTQDQQLVGIWDSAGGDLSYRLLYDHSETDFTVEWSSSGFATTVTLNATATATVETWTLVVATFHATNGVALYVGEDGDANTTEYTDATAVSVFLGAGGLNIGRQTGAISLMDGMVDEAFVLGRVLSKTEIDEILTNGLAGDR